MGVSIETKRGESFLFYCREGAYKSLSFGGVERMQISTLLFMNTVGTCRVDIIY